MMTQLARLPDVKEVTRLSRSTIYRLIKSGDFPAPRPVGKRAVAWDPAVIEKWIQERMKGQPLPSERAR